MLKYCLGLLYLQISDITDSKKVKPHRNFERSDRNEGMMVPNLKLSNLHTKKLNIKKVVKIHKLVLTKTCK